MVFHGGMEEDAAEERELFKLKYGVEEIMWQMYTGELSPKQEKTIEEILKRLVKMDPPDERRDTKRKQEYFDHLYNVADSAYGMPTRCPCGGRIIDEVRVKEEYDTRPGKRFFSCINYEADGLHYRQPWVIGVQEEMVRLRKRVEEDDEMIKCVPILSKQIESLEAQVKRLTLLLDKLTGDVYNLTVQAAALEKVKGCPGVVTGVWEIKSDVDGLL
ncbi:hypothetical protein Bca52824_044099 [Brassica carinata]|uniref:Uncharacterized protein n=1 Tax=Brassica carinata TaxID=52824 RepID=A0A8X7S281_BRACI|nr:hypothetical protein Bca52824_044099 [Brassica carinata]